MPPLRQSFSWDGFARTGAEPEALLRAAADIGYWGVDLPPPELWPRIRDHGLALVCITGHPLAPDGLNSQEHFPALSAQVEAALRQAEAWGIQRLLVFSGNRRSASAAEAAEITAEHLRRLSQPAADAGVMLLLELLNSKVQGRDYQADHTAWGVQVCRMVGAPNVRLLYDIYHMQMMEGDIIATIRQHHEWIGHIHTAGVPGRGDLDSEQELYYPAIMRAIAETGYTGVIGHEFFPKGDAVAALKAAFETCRVMAPHPK